MEGIIIGIVSEVNYTTHYLILVLYRFVDTRPTVGIERGNVVPMLSKGVSEERASHSHRLMRVYYVSVLHGDTSA